MAGAVGLREVRYGDAGRRTTPPLDEGRLEPVLRLRPQVHRLLALRARLRRDAGYARADDLRSRLRLAGRRQPGETFIDSECVSCGACVQACPTATLSEKSLVEVGVPTPHACTTTCAYCGVGCSFKAEVRGDEVVRMVPNKDGHANQGHSCVKGRFACGYATHPDRITKPMIRGRSPIRGARSAGTRRSATRRASSSASRRTYGPGSIGGITSSRCTNEEAFLVQKLVRAAFGNNNVDTCARVCHSPTGYGLKPTLGESAGTQDFKSVDEGRRRAADRREPDRWASGVRLADEAPAAAGREADRRRPAAHRRWSARRTSRPPITCSSGPGTNVALVNALAHVIVTEGLVNQAFVESAASRVFDRWQAFVAGPKTVAGGHRGDHRRAGRRRCGPPRACTRPAPTPRSTTASASPSTARARRWSWASRTSRWRPATSAARASASTRCAGRTTCRARATWARSRTSSRATGTCPTTPCAHSFEAALGRAAARRAGAAHPEHVRGRARRHLQGAVRPGRGHRPVRPEHAARQRRAGLARLLVVQDLFLNETAKFAHVLLPGHVVPREGRHVHQRRAAHQPGAPGDGAARPASTSGSRLRARPRHRLPHALRHTRPRSWTRSRPPTPTFAGVSFDKLDELGSIQWPCNAGRPLGTPVMHIGEFVRGKGRFIPTPYVPTDERIDAEASRCC